MANKTTKFNLAWSFRPIVYSMRIIGIDLDVSTKSWPKFRRWVFLLFGLGMLIFSGYYSIAVTSKIINETLASDSPLKPVRLTIVTLRDILFPVAVFTNVVFKWPTLWKKMQEMERFFLFPIEFYHQIHRTQTVLVVTGFVMGSIHNSLALLTLKKSYDVFKTDPIRPLGLVVSGIYFSLPVMLFGCLVRVASMGIQLIIADVQIYHPAEDIAGYRVLRWKKSYSLILSFVDEVDQFFRLGLIFFFSFTFIEFITRSSAVFVNHTLGLWLHPTALINLLILMSEVVFNTGRMKANAENLAKEMNQIQHPNPSVQMNVGQLINQIDHEYPKIEPFQMFEINPGLFPTLIGLAVSYSVVRHSYHT